MLGSTTSRTTSTPTIFSSYRAPPLHHIPLKLKINFLHTTYWALLHIGTTLVEDLKYNRAFSFLVWSNFVLYVHCLSDKLVRVHLTTNVGLLHKLFTYNAIIIISPCRQVRSHHLRSFCLRTSHSSHLQISCSQLMASLHSQSC